MDHKVHSYEAHVREKAKTNYKIRHENYWHLKQIEFLTFRDVECWKSTGKICGWYLSILLRRGKEGYLGRLSVKWHFTELTSKSWNSDCILGTTSKRIFSTNSQCYISSNQQFNLVSVEELCFLRIQSKWFKFTCKSICSLGVKLKHSVSVSLKKSK